MSLYKQLKLQRELENATSLNEGARKSMLYTNERLINDISELIEATDTDYPKSYQKVAKSEINNTILTAI